MAHDLIAFDTEVDHPCPALWEMLQTPETYPRFCHGLGSCELAPDFTQLFVVRFASPRGTLVTHGMRQLLRQSALEMRLESTETSRCFASIRLTPDGDRTRVAVRIFAIGLLHPDIASVGDSAVRHWVQAGLRRMSEYLAGKPSSVLANTGEAHSLHLSVLRTMIASGVVRASRPDRGLRQLNSLARWGFTLAGGLGAAAVRAPEAAALVDRHGTTSYEQTAARTAFIAAGLAADGFSADSTFAVLSRNSSAMVEAMIAVSKLGATLVLLNTGLAARAIEDIVDEHRVDAVFADDEFEQHVRYLPERVLRIAVQSNSTVLQRYSLGNLISVGAEAKPVTPPKRPGRLVVLTSGTTGTPKGARRPTPPGFGAIAAMLSRMPLHRGEVMLLAAPLFHAWGLAALQVSTPLLATVVLQERFDAEACLAAVERHRCTALVLVPVMLQRILELPAAVVRRYDTSSLKVVASSGSPIPGDSCTRFMDTFGDVLYNFYGSTEVSWGTIADPVDLRLAPMTAGRPPLGTRIAVLDPSDAPVPIGAVGRVFVGNDMLFEGYTNAATPAVADRLMDTGDLGYLDASGRLFIAGRDDEMIISGGENVFPRPVEEAIALLPQVAEVAVVGVPDPEFGQRLVAFVVRAEGAALDEAMVKSYVRNRLSRFSIPRDVTFVAELPRTATGKILKRELT